MSLKNKVQRLNGNGRATRLRYSLVPKLNTPKGGVTGKFIPITIYRPTIEQLQFTGAESFSNSSVKSKLALNHPCKELVWVLHTATNESAKEWSDFTVNAAAAAQQTVATAKLQLNGHDRFSARAGDYFNLVQPYQHHTTIPSTGIYVYSFALNPEQHQPSGSVNMSRIDNATLLLTTNTSSTAFKLRVYAVNYNVIRIMAGMGGLLHSN